MMGVRREVREGQHFRRIGAAGYVWEVVAVRKDNFGARHAQMRRLDDPLTWKTLAVTVLLDPNQFEAFAAD